MPRAWHQQIKRAPAAERTVDGIVFDSKSEAKRWAELMLMERGKEIFGLRRQVKIPLIVAGNPVKIRSAGFPNGRACVYTADFSYYSPNGLVYEEHKGHDDPTARLRRAVVEAMYGIEIVVTGPAAAATPRLPMVRKRA